MCERERLLAFGLRVATLVLAIMISIISNSPRCTTLNFGALRTEEAGVETGVAAAAEAAEGLDGGCDDALGGGGEDFGAAGGTGPAEALRMRCATGTPPL